MKNIKLFILFLLTVLLTACSDPESLPLSGVGDEIPEEEMENSVPDEPPVPDSPENAPEEKPVTVYICGSVESPGVYELPAGSRVCDALDAAGGFSEGADEKRINLAGMLCDGEMIYFPKEGEPLPEGSSDHLQNSSGESAGGLVNINTAGEDALTALPGIGSSKARAIVMYREEHGGFKDIREIMNVSGIGENLFKQIEGLICV